MIELVSKSKSILVYYTVFAVGLAMIALYVWWVADAGVIDLLYGLVLVDYALFVASTLAISFSRTRMARIALTLLSAVFGGIEGYLNLVLFPQPYSGLILFLWAAFGVLLTVASLSWLRELSRAKRDLAIPKASAETIRRG
ncbi:MAG: hypothetical protein C4K47_00035 [Candidatus Thorarchaeota archaeon]|nr:MAG: hypothetical protein C4K47_00035 [Candidatus Thorarchaeota archaeon]